MSNSVKVLAAALDERDANYTALLALLDSVARGDVWPHQLRVDVAARTWEVRPRAAFECGQQILTLADLQRMAKQAEAEQAARDAESARKHLDAERN